MDDVKRIVIWVIDLKIHSISKPQTFLLLYFVIGYFSHQVALLFVIDNIPYLSQTG
jgi:hypothetical protein